MKRYLFNSLLVLIVINGIAACNIYKSAERHVDKRMKAGEMKGRIVMLDRDRVEYWDNGKDKPVLVLVHGFGATAKYQWYKQIDWLSENYRVIMPNLNYFGNTEPAEGQYSVADQVRMVHRLLDSLGINNYNLCGVSYGGLVAFEMAQERPDRVEKLIAFDAPIKFMYESDIEITCQRFRVQSVEELFVPSGPMGLRKLRYMATGKRSMLPSASLRRFYLEMYAGNLKDKRALITQLLSDIKFYNDRSYSLKMPVLLIWGDNDPVIPADRGEQLKEYIGDNAAYHVIKNGAHMPNLSKTNKFDKILREFLFSGN